MNKVIGGKVRTFTMLFMAATAAAALSGGQGAGQDRPRMRQGEQQSLDAAAAAPWLMQLRTQRINQTLGLPEDQAKIIAQRWAQYDRDFLGRARQMGQLRSHFNQILIGPGAEEDKNAKLKPLLDQFMELRRQQQDLKAKFEDDIRGQLSPAQQVRLIILVDDLQKTIRDGIREAIKENRANRKGN